MTTDSKSELSLISRLRQELGMPINAIIGYSEIIIEEIEEIDRDVEYLGELEQIRECGIELLASINSFFDPAKLSNSQLNFQQIISNSKLRTELEKSTQLVINNCRQLVPLIEEDFAVELEKINSAANQLLQEINSLTEIVPHSANISQAADSETEVVMDTSSLSVADLAASYTILIVDDSITNRELLANQVEAQGYKAVTAADGKQAIQMIQTGAYDLILLDIIMPEIDGYQVLQWIHNSPWQYIPTIMISALDQIDSVVKCINMGAADYLTKPFNFILLKARLGACLEQKRLRDQESSYIKKLAKANQKISKLNNRLQAENTRLSTELEITQRLQTMLLPKEKELNQIKVLEIAGFTEPAAEVGGDYYDVFQHQGRVIIGIGDVSGHGLESGVLMLMLQTAVRTLIENNETNPKQFFEVLNRTIYKNVQRMDSDKNLTLSLVDYCDGVLSVSGQHEEILIVRAGGVIERIDTVDLGFPIGLEETIEDFVFQAQIPLQQNEVVVLYTDGITEAENRLGVHYGLKQLCTVVQQNWQQSAQNIRQAVIQDLRSHIGVEPLYDDITLVVFKRK
ncbi:MAG TPA: SpoIIE family protein phosphatase [Coleofasciculaceae cyanobacterium]|jgi:sigma-B regulation protein RsbU (phosphoserine phosphatase)